MCSIQLYVRYSLSVTCSMQISFLHVMVSFTNKTENHNMWTEILLKATLNTHIVNTYTWEIRKVISYYKDYKESVHYTSPTVVWTYTSVSCLFTFSFTNSYGMATMHLWQFVGMAIKRNSNNYFVLSYLWSPVICWPSLQKKTLLF